MSRKKHKKNKSLELITPKTISKAPIKAAASSAATDTEVDADAESEIEIRIPQEVFQKIMHWINKSNNEVSGFGNLSYDARAKRFTVEDAFLLEQYNSGASTEIEAASMGKMMFKHRNFGAGALKWWWHSHVNMAVFWSGTDTDTIKQYGSNGYIVASVFNKRQEIRSAVCYKAESIVTPTNKLFGSKTKTISTILVDDVTTLIEYPLEWDTEYTANIKERVYVSSYTPPTADKGYLNPYRNYNRENASRFNDDTPSTEPNGNKASLDNWEEEYETRRFNRSLSEDTHPAKKKFELIGGLDISQSYEKGRVLVKGIGWVWEKDLDAATEPTPTPKDAVQTSMFGTHGDTSTPSKKVGENIFINGILGDYGIAKEARALQMPVSDYERTLATGTEKELDELTEKLCTLEQAGYFENPTTN